MEKNNWIHQDKAIDCFLREESGILEMATGTGKTRTAIRIMETLFRENKVDQILVLTYGNDLLEQWYRELLLRCQDTILFRWYGNYNEFSRFQITKAKEKIILISREGERIKYVLGRLKDLGERTLLVFDEVHGAGSEGFRKAVENEIPFFHYRLGLSATPIREFDQEGSVFLEKAIGPVIFHFDIADAIKNGILCCFRYIPLHYQLTSEEKKKKQNIIAAYEQKRKKGIAFQEEDLYRDLARVNKLAINKISLFQEYIQKEPQILERCIIFVETREYGLALQKMLLSYIYKFHTYYGNDDSSNLRKFARGQIDCLITCKKISEGIDIQSVKNIVLFSSDRSKLATTQRIGRSLRKSPADREKVASIVDFIYDSGKSEDVTADSEREQWLTELSKVREE